MRRFVVERLEVSYMINYFVIKVNLFLYQFALLVLGRVQGDVPAGRGPEEDPGHGGETIHVSRLAWEHLGIQSGRPCSDCCPNDLTTHKAKEVDLL